MVASRACGNAPLMHDAHARACESRACVSPGVYSIYTTYISQPATRLIDQEKKRAWRSGREGGVSPQAEQK